MKKILLTFMIIGFLGVFAAESYGQNTPRVDKREHKQKSRIKNGVKSKNLTGKETGKLLKQQAGIRKYEHKAKSDGNVTLKERARLQHKENQSSRSIYKAKHNSKKRN